MKRLVVYNHEYHVRNFKKLAGDIYLKVNSREPMSLHGDIQLPIVESIGLHKRLFLRLKYQNLVDHLIDECSELIIFGMQDYLSNFICWQAIKKGVAVRVVPDNLEFFLRPGFLRCKLTFKRLVKASILGLPFWKLNRDYLFFCNRLLFRIRGHSLIDFKLSCFATAANRQPTGYTADYAVFVSQPYYLDYNLNLNDWSDSVVKVLDHAVNAFHSMRVRFHQRDMPEFKNNLKRFDVSLNDTDGKPVYVGFFSTYMIELSLSGAEVYSYYESVRDYFPDEYNLFVERLAKALGLDLTGHIPWRVNMGDIENLSVKGF